VGWNFKSDIFFYDSRNKNGKITQKAYIKQILEPFVKPLLDKGRDIVLFEDRDSGHGPGKKNPVREWKDKHGLKFYFNVSNSLDLNIIENCWQEPKHYVAKYPHWNDEETRNLIREGWAEVSQEFINRMIKTYPDRFRDVIKAEG
jgi:hypothetical protein